MRTTLALGVCWALVGCITPDDGSDPDGDPDFDGKADGTAASATAKGGVDFAAARELAFADATGQATKLVYATFELSGAATVSLETKASDADTVLYIYKPSGDKWGSYLVRDDDSGTGTLSKLSRRLDAGSYRVLVRRKTGTGTPHVSLAASCSGSGCTAPARGCTPTETRLATPGVFVGPTDWQTTFGKLIDGAQVSLDLQMYQFSVPELADHVIAAHKRGVDVRVILDGNQTVNATPRAAMVAAGVPLQSAPSVFSYSHAKYLVADGALGVIATGNFNDGAVTKERNYALTDTDTDDLADLAAIFEADWSANGTLALDCTRLVVSPINSQRRILDHINGAKKTLDTELLYLNDPEIRDALVAAKARGVAVRVLLNDPGQTATTKPQIDDLVAQGVPVGYNTSFYLHAKIIIADGVAHVGSENMSVTSLTKNREVGALVAEPATAAKIQAQFDSDWAGAVTQ
jgi:phosphatidylserine/phosphatidylglycerophosphate/cardiolipin synthase-like enzyme